MRSVPFSLRTIVVFGIALALVVTTAMLVGLEVGGETGATAAANIGEALVVVLAAVVVALAARRLDWSTSLGRPWLFIAVGVAAYAVGDIVWAVIESGMGLEVPYPGLPDVFYLLEYPAVALGMVSAGIAFRGLIPLRRPVVVAVIVGVAAVIAIVFGLVVPHVLPAEDASIGVKLLSVAYPMADVMLMVVPAVFVLGVIAALSGGRLAWPWMAVAVGTVFIALSDIGYSWLSVYDEYASGSIIDYGWGLGHAFIMLGALIAWDLAGKPE